MRKFPFKRLIFWCSCVVVLSFLYCVRARKYTPRAKHNNKNNSALHKNARTSNLHIY